MNDVVGIRNTLSCLQVRVAALVRGVLDISGASPRRYFFEVLQHFATAELEVDRLEYFATPDGRNDLYTYNQKEGEGSSELNVPDLTRQLTWIHSVTSHYPGHMAAH